MGKLIDQLYAACDADFYHSPPGQSLLLFLVSLTRGIRTNGSSGIDRYLCLGPALAPDAQVHSTLEELVQESKIGESVLVVGLIRALEDVLDDCSQEAPGAMSDWSPATRWLVRHGLLCDGDGLLTVTGRSESPAPSRARQVRADLVLWQELTALILEEHHLKRAIRTEMEDED